MIEGCILPVFFVMAGFALGPKRAFVRVILFVAADALVGRLAICNARFVAFLAGRFLALYAHLSG